MAEKIKIGIGAPTYNSVSRLEQLLTSLEFYKDTNYDYKIVILDDGTPDLNKRLEVKALAERFGVDFIQHEKNEGIPKSWNDLVRHFDSEISVLFNDDICVCDENWLKCIVYALENNEKVACVGGPLIQIDVMTGLPNKNYNLPDLENSVPGVAGAVVGCSFAFKRKAFDSVLGFESSIKSFYEETDFGFKLIEKGYYSVMLPYPPFEHRGSQTFANNQILNIQHPDPILCSMEKYKEIMSKKYPIERIEPIPGFVYRMDYSRVLFSLKWGCEDFWDKPQCEVHSRLLDNRKTFKMKYLNSKLIEREVEI